MPEETRDEYIKIRLTATLKNELQKQADAANRKLADYCRVILAEVSAERKVKAKKTVK